VALVSRREREVLTRVAEGDGNKKIAADLGLSVKTVRKHRQNVMRKLSLHNSAAITVYAIENGFLFKDPAA
jgi:DNA-binding NarL/FixJ family response regulator